MLRSCPEKPEKKEIAIVNWDGVLQPRSASPQQLVASMFSFAMLYSYQYDGFIRSLPAAFQTTARAVFATVYMPYVVKLYFSTRMTNLITQLKLGGITKEMFFNNLLMEYFPFLNTPGLGTSWQTIEKAWLDPRIQPLTAREIARIKCLLENFNQVILVANSNTPDIQAFIQNLAQTPEITAFLAQLQPASEYLNGYSRATSATIPTAQVILENLLALGDNVGILTSVQTGEWKIQTGALAVQKDSSGFLPKLLTALQQKSATVISDAPADRRVKQILPNMGIEVYSGNGYFKDITRWQQARWDVYDNWPLILLVVFALLAAYSLAVRSPLSLW